MNEMMKTREKVRKSNIDRERKRESEKKKKNERKTETQKKERYMASDQR
jgi:hypothetical protein